MIAIYQDGQNRISATEGEFQDAPGHLRLLNGVPKCPDAGRNWLYAIHV
jgi:hypothetical protein